MGRLKLLFIDFLMKYKVNLSVLQGNIAIPPSKSQTLRAILFGSLAKGSTVIRNYLPSPDIKRILTVCQSWGIPVEITKDTLTLTGKKINELNPITKIDAGNSGLILRLCSTIAALSPSRTMITGDRSIKTNRPMSPVIDGLSQLGVKVKCLKQNGYAPLSIQGPLQPGSLTINGTDSQPVSSFIIAGCFASGPVQIKVITPGEKPWVNLTLSWLNFLQLSYSKKPDFTEFTIPGNQEYAGFNYHVPGDLSSLAFPIAAALITKSHLTISNVDLQDPQGDKQIIDVFKKMGAEIKYDPYLHVISVSPSHSLKGLSIDINDFIDSIAAISVVACFADTPTHIKNAAVARTKECDRIACLTQELKKMNADITELPDGLIIRPSKLQGTRVSSYNDHRLAMALTVAGMGATHTTEINGTACIRKTFPKFFESFVNLGAKIEKIF